jgi:hypothetical protein
MMDMVGLFIFVFPLLMLVFLKLFLGLLLALQTQSRFVLLRTKTLALLSLGRVDRDLSQFVWGLKADVAAARYEDAGQEEQGAVAHGVCLQKF